MTYHQEIQQLITKIGAESQAIEAKMNYYKQSCNFTEVIETLLFVYSVMELLNRQLPPLPSGKSPSFEVDEAYLQTFQGTE
ncbi:MAG TPA: hypothetical protein V6D15_12320 [Oculatellaceae cyanobacterium]|jgi:hypothetical protein